MGSSSQDRILLRDLAERYLVVCNKPVQDERRGLWRRRNSLKAGRPLIYTRAFAWHELPESRCQCEDPFLRTHEGELRRKLYWDTLDDDAVFEPWVTVRAACVTPSEGVWGLPTRWVEGKDPRGAKRMDPPIVEPDDFQRMTEPRHEIDEEKTARRVSRLHDAIGDIIALDVDRSPEYRVWNGDISTQLIQLRGIDQFMFDMLERPEWLHGLLAFMRDGILRTHEEAETAGHWTLSAHENQAMSYAEELPDPACNSASLKRDRLWCFCASQETTLLGPDRFNEFMLQYQIPIVERFGLTAYGCCEDLTLKIPVLRQIPNLRRIAVAPAADVAACAEQIGEDYVLSYRPSPSDMVGYDFEPDRIRRILRRDLEACRSCSVDITLKDVETVQNDPSRIPQWVRIAREVIEECWS